jgi:hypothetical protein
VITWLAVTASISALVIFWFTPENQRLANRYQVPEYQVWAEPKPHDCDFFSAPLGSKHCRYEKVVDVNRACGDPGCRATAVFESWHKVEKVEIGTLKGQVFAVTRTGNFHPAISASAHLISCEPFQEERPGIRIVTVTTNACEYFLEAKHKLRPESKYAFAGAFAQADLHHRDIPFEVDEHGFFSVSATTGSYIVYVDGLAGGHRCIWMLSGVQLGKTPVTIKLSPSAIVEAGGNEDLRGPSLPNRI